MKPRLRMGLRLGFFLYAGFLLAAPGGDIEFGKRLSETGLTYSTPSGFVDDGPNIALEKELNETFDSSSPFVVHRIRSTDGMITAYVDIRVLGMDMKNPALAAAYPLVFESNAREYCALVSSSPCSVSTKLPASVVRADYRADLGMVLKANHPDQGRIGGHKKASVIAISKPSSGIIYATIAYDSDSEFERGYQAVRHMLKFKS
ncbi:MAG: hypothetical protein ABSF28_17790 [Terracidiphilus sp.]|jgi:hypothetical protein